MEYGVGKEKGAEEEAVRQRGSGERNKETGGEFRHEENISNTPIIKKSH